jgi:hypothetical protein
MTTTLRQQLNDLEIFIQKQKELGINDPFELEMKVANTMTEFYDSYPSIVKRLCKDEVLDNTYLYKMLNLLDEVADGKNTVENIETTLGSELAEKFVYPVVKTEEEKNE